VAGKLFDRLADRDRHRQREHQVALLERVEDRGVEQCVARRGRPAATLPSATRGLLVCGDDGPGGGAGRGQLPCEVVGGLADPQVTVGKAEAQLAGDSVTSSSGARPSISAALSRLTASARELAESS
jgi:hypothetical protein